VDAEAQRAFWRGGEGGAAFEKGASTRKTFVSLAVSPPARFWHPDAAYFMLSPVYTSLFYFRWYLMRKGRCLSRLSQ